MEMHQVRYFLAVARTLNFTRAADECNVTQPSLTRAIQKLEDEFGGLLFRRERALTHLTDLGRSMHPHLERTFEAAQAAKALAKGIGKAEVTPLSLGISSAISSPALREVLAEVGANLTGFELSTATGTSAALIERALGGELDLVVVEQPGEATDRWEAWPLFRQRYHVLLRPDHPLATREGVELADLSELVWIECGTDAALRLRAVAAREGRTLAFRHRADGGAHARELVMSGLGSAVGVRGEGPAAVSFRDGAMDAPVVVASIAGRRRAPAAEAFVRACRARAWEGI